MRFRPFRTCFQAVTIRSHIHSAFIVSIVRQAYAGKVGSTADPTWDDMPAALVSVAELMAGFLAASIPTYRPLWRRIFAQDEKSNRKSTDGFDSGQNGHSAEDGPWISEMKTQTKVSSGAGMSRPRTMCNFEGISVTRDIELSTQHMAEAHRDDGWMRVSDNGSDDTLGGSLPDNYR